MSFKENIELNQRYFLKILYKILDLFKKKDYSSLVFIIVLYMFIYVNDYD